MKFGTGSWRDVIVARRSRKSSVSFDAPAITGAPVAAEGNRKVWPERSIAVQIYSQGLITDDSPQHAGRATLAWAEGEVEGYLRA